MHYTLKSGEIKLKSSLPIHKRSIEEEHGSVFIAVRLWKNRIGPVINFNKFDKNPEFIQN